MLFNIKSISFLVILLEFVVFSLGYVAIMPPEVAKSKDHEGYCYHQSFNALIKVNGSEIFSNCEEVSCGSDYTMTIYGSV